MAEFLDDQDTQLCDNCKKEIPVFNFTIHEIHCQRNIGMCPVCKEPFPKSDMESHMATEHCQVTCKCNKKLEKRQLKKHEETECPLRLALCQHCDLELSVLKLKDHEDYCGARTELCGSCGRNVLVKDLKTHPEVCGRFGEEKKDEVAVPPNAYDESWGQDGIWIASQLLRQIEALDPPMRIPRRPMRAFESDLFHSRTTNQRNMTAQFPIQNNLLEEQERQEKNRTRQASKEGGEDSANLDFMLALSLQNEGQARSVAEQDFWRAVCGAEQSFEGSSALNDMKGAADRTMLPCEFCEELYPEELLIDHQTSCNPSCALPSLNMGSTSPRGVEDPDVIFQKFLQQAANNQLDSLMGLSSSPPVKDSIIIPCEFCGVQLEEEVLFHHQDQCDQRPATANNHVTEGIPRQDFQPPETSPDLPKRRVRHQGDLSSGYMDDIKQETAKGPTYPLPPSRPINNMTATYNRLSTSTSGPRPGCQPSPPRILKLNNLDSQDSRGRNRNSHNAAMVTGHVPVIHPGRNLYPENLVPSFPRAPSGRYGVSGRNEGGRNSRVTSTTANYRNRTAKAKPPKQQGAGDAEEEEEEE
ncbi:TRAF-type zinc finger domain-containing protein 1 isoform X2 [Canis lupus baileyi]|uniref:TRAF-type zinc finger domain-containing protein 1 n=4 Tax=Canis lupus TaxID=9612 RepID=A0A8C0P1Q1_CANLF|nr:TRAF-type zinc finger domain-containing protein 1 isoform X2 [Canis lupus dingo]XP_038292653.1 TRAF-type zinc finger domain-containing protein 1 isoform X1 [Canis lupus familiaris]XP_038431062.1 TRAF-type zinc finger domain-containing protein 1 isoform X1 [Canis lupus familiaris]XP_534682.2 TRAF-type zinc finger domain-containing protein 1 isoform X1 [Canis lupus familiaris]|eukprot:XP_534682.2 TRAF-type zinc finger domain-containing protein 1 isoform X1 [Canis lupus familiaris]